MEFEFWWLLAFPLFFGLGWLAARIDLKQLLTESRSLPLSYFKGLNFLLNEQPDKAIEAFIEVVKVDPQTVDLHFALGSLFRRRGEVERAIRMHQNLVERPDLDPEQKLTATFELAQDYLKAGLLDRAEELFQKLIGTSHAESALKCLLQVYELEKEWVMAIEVARQLEKLSSRPWNKEIAHFHCELATAAMLRSDPDAARAHLADALAADKKCARASILLGDLEASQGRHEQAIAAWLTIESQDGAYFSLVARKLLDSYRELNRAEEGLAVLRGFLGTYPSLDLLDSVFHTTMEWQGPEPAHRLVREELRRNPTLIGLDRLLEAQLIESPPERRRDLELIRNLVQQYTKGLALYKCDHCGFRARQFYWRCPACGDWETYAPRRTEEKLLAA
jgi:lipopolysaccharide biosynthesis regulator YciM